ncbi:MAG: NYN domain-containing protein [Gemmatimonadota bacterium]|nr:NYN domain-containing protein [Gemmatimonadota bacterium]
MHRGPQAAALNASGTSPFHAPNAALLIDFDNVTMGIRSDLNAELRSLLSSDIVKGKVSVQRAYADWRRYPQYIVPLSESSIDLIFAPAYGSSKKNATDIRLAIDALELIFTRPEIGTFILLSGDSDFSSLVIKLKEYGKYVIGVGIRESSSDLLVQNCDEYYSYNALAGLINTREEDVTKWDPWQLAGEAIQRMKRNGDVMRADRLKQVMQQIDSSFDEKNLGMSKFTRFVQDAAHRGILSSHKMDNGQLEVDLPKAAGTAPVAVEGEVADSSAPAAVPPLAREPRESRSRRGRGGRGRDRERPRGENAEATDIAATGEHAASTATSAATTRASTPVSSVAHPRGDRPAQSELSFTGAAPESAQPARASAPVAEPVPAARAPRESASVPSASAGDEIGTGGMRLTRDEAFDLVRRAVAQIAATGGGTRASDVRSAAHGILGRDSESLSERNFVRILKDAHDSDIIDLRRRGDDYEVRPAVVAAPIVDQLGAAAIANAPAPPPKGPPAPRGMGTRGGGGRMQRSAAKASAPLDLLSVGVVDYDAPVSTPAAAPRSVATQPPAAPAPAPGATAAPVADSSTATTKPSRGRKGTAKKAAAPSRAAPAAASAPVAKTAAKTAAKPAASKVARKKTATRK